MCSSDLTGFCRGRRSASFDIGDVWTRHRVTSDGDKKRRRSTKSAIRRRFAEPQTTGAPRSTAPPAGSKNIGIQVTISTSYAQTDFPDCRWPYGPLSKGSAGEEILRR